MAQFDPNKYATVDQRIAEFYEAYPEGSIRTRLVSDNGPRVVFEARIYRTREDALHGAYTSGWAHEVEGNGPVNKTNHIENAETSAVGRALANLGFSGSINGKRAPRPSREEMQQAEARGKRQKPDRAAERAWTEKAARLEALSREVDVLRKQAGETDEGSDAAEQWAASIINSALGDLAALGKAIRRMEQRQEKLMETLESTGA